MTEEKRAQYIEAGNRLAIILHKLRQAVKPNVSSEILDDLAEKLIKEGDDGPIFLGYRPEGANRPYPASLCVSINDEVVHGIPNESPRVFQEGDIVSLDLGLIHKNVIVDSAITMPIGGIALKLQKLITTTEAALIEGIRQAVPGNCVGDISHAIQVVIERAGFSVVKDLGGHGIGATVHEEPFIPNFGKPGKGPKLTEGMVLAIEPITSMGEGAVFLGNDGYTFRTRDGSPSAHFEHTIIIEKNGPRILTTP